MSPVNAAVKEVCSLPILNPDSRNIHDSDKNLKAAATAGSQRSEAFIEYPVKVEGALWSVLTGQTLRIKESVWAAKEGSGHAE